jgi:hypothetical protein
MRITKRTQDVVENKARGAAIFDGTQEVVENTARAFRSTKTPFVCNKLLELQRLPLAGPPYGGV